MIYTIIDVETTGKSNKLTEISMFKYDGTKVIDQLTSLINPEIEIPNYITALTGIDNSMVGDAPVFSKIAQRILDFTDKAVFVAHNGYILEYFFRNCDFNKLLRTRLTYIIL